MRIRKNKTRFSNIGVNAMLSHAKAGQNEGQNSSKRGQIQGRFFGRTKLVECRIILSRQTRSGHLASTEYSTLVNSRRDRTGYESAFAKRTAN